MITDFHRNGAGAMKPEGVSEAEWQASQQLILLLLKENKEFDAVISIRNGGAFVPRPECLLWNGRRVRARVLWAFEDDETSIYQDEYACQIADFEGEKYPRTWIASGDLVMISAEKIGQ